MSGTVFYCGNEQRRQLVRDHATLNGIDYLEVLDDAAPPGAPPQQTLVVHFIKPLTFALELDNMDIEGGVRVAPVDVVWFSLAQDAQTLFDDGLISEAEREYYLTLPEPDATLIVRTDSSGDYSTYTFVLRESSTSDAPPGDFDQKLIRVDFSFKVDCDSDFDCAPEDDCPPEVPDTPPIDYLAKDYASFKQLILDRMAVTMPDWKERNPADMGVALVELLAYAGDRLSYYQDSVATEAYLGTARRRESVRRHARLLDYMLHEGCNARAWVTLEVDSTASGVEIAPVGDDGLPVKFLTRILEQPVIDPARFDRVFAEHQPDVFELRHTVHLNEAHNQMQFYTWTDEECCLPVGATSATIYHKDGLEITLQAGDVLIFEERVDPETGQTADANREHRQAVRLTTVTEGEDRLTGTTVWEIAWDEEDALTFSLCISAVIDGRLEDEVGVARGNVALVDYGMTIPEEFLPPPQGALRYRPRLNENDVTFRVGDIPTDLRDGDILPAARMIQQDPARALPDAWLTGTSDVWLPKRDLLASSRFEPHFVLEMDNYRRPWLRFGDDVQGRTPTAGDALAATYRIGNGATGNVGAESIAHVVTDQAGIVSVRNPLPAWGGTDPESLEEARQYAPYAFRTQERAVTEDDYAEVAQRHPEVQKAVARRLWTGSWYTMFLTVDRFGGRSITPEFEVEMRDHLERYRLAGHDVEIDPPRFVSLDIVLEVCVKAGYFRDRVKAVLLDEFSTRRLTDGRTGFFHPDNFTFGQPVYLSQIIARVMSVSGVDYVEVQTFQRYDELPNNEIDEGAVSMHRLEIARCDNDPNQPHNGKIEFVMKGGM